MTAQCISCSFVCNWNDSNLWGNAKARPIGTPSLARRTIARRQ